ncbi:hypothetical protein [Kitasatospora sp. NPDC050543]|uniref:hypothetical protein n=1 Tax=Kitasatospora sp. NPDC050543 TaxID=3364054 RepID=UPI0037BD9270
MGIGYLLLYAALAVVALWLLAEVLLQNRAPLHWRGLALGGFLGVVAGMALGSVVVIGAGAALFALGQTFVTLSVKRGYAAGWSLRRADGSLPGPLAKVPLLSAATGGAAVAAVAVAVEQVGEVSAIEEPEPVPAVEETAAFEMQELTADGVYTDAPSPASGYYDQAGYEQPDAVQSEVYADPYAGATGYQSGYPDQQWQQPQQQPAFGYDQGQGQGYGGYQQDQYAGYQQQATGYEQQQPAYDPYGQQTGYDQQQQLAWDAGQQQWQPQPDQHAVPQQPTSYGYQQGSWQQQG